MDRLFWATLAFLAFVFAVFVFAVTVSPFGGLTAASFAFSLVAVILAKGFADCWRSCFTARSPSLAASQDASRELDVIERPRRRAIYSLPASEVEDVDDELVVVDDPDF